MTDATIGGVAGTQLRYRDAPARRQWILHRLRQRGFLSTAQLVRELGVSDMTVRRDLRLLEGKVQVVHGGVSLPHGDSHTSAFSTRAMENAEAKHRIATACAAKLAANDVIAIDGGTTTFGVVDALPDDFAGCVITHSVPVLARMVARPEARTVALGGDLLPASQAFTGPLAVDAAGRLRARVFFLGAAAVDERGVYVETDAERPVKLALMNIADTVTLLIDATKFTRPAPVLLCPLDRVDIILTDATPPPKMARALKTAGVHLHILEPT